MRAPSPTREAYVPPNGEATVKSGVTAAAPAHLQSNRRSCSIERMFGKLLIICLVTLIAVSVVRTSNGAGHEQRYVVKPTDTLWSIASSHYAGDPREGVWKLRRRNHLGDETLRVGQRLVLPG
jgi:LysM repeat protein